MGLRLRRLARGLAATALVGAFGVALLLALLWLEHNRPLELPAPTGPFGVGRVSAGWVDELRVDPFASSPNQKRELVVWLWYPAQRNEHAVASEYLPEPWQRAHHFSFSNQALENSQIVMTALSAVGAIGDLDPRTGLAYTTRCVREFFDVHLRGAPREALYSGPLVSGARFETK